MPLDDGVEENRARAKLIKMRCPQCGIEMTMREDVKLELEKGGDANLACLTCVMRARDGMPE